MGLNFREAQLETLAVPNTGMAVAIDLGEWNDIRSLNKEAVGKRLAMAAQNIAYGGDVVAFRTHLSIYEN